VFLVLHWISFLSFLGCSIVLSLFLSISSDLVIYLPFTIVYLEFFCSTNGIAGRVYSKIFDEHPICCETGPVGLFICFALIPLGIYSPTGGLGVYCCLSNYLHCKAIEKYKIQDEPLTSNPCGNCLWIGLNYPCSIFQVFSSQQYFDHKKEPKV
jgi:hypothetical protein